MHCAQKERKRLKKKEALLYLLAASLGLCPFTLILLRFAAVTVGHVIVSTGVAGVHAVLNKVM